MINEYDFFNFFFLLLSATAPAIETMEALIVVLKLYHVKVYVAFRDDLFSQTCILNSQNLRHLFTLEFLNFRAHTAISFSYCLKCCSCISCLLGA